MAAVVELENSRNNQEKVRRSVNLWRQVLMHPFRYRRAVDNVKALMRQRAFYDEINQKIALYHPEYLLDMQTTLDPEKRRIARMFRIDRIGK